MVRIKPFKGIRPPKELAKEVASRPYDVLNSVEAKAEATERSLLHIIKPEIDFDPIADEHSQEVYDKAVENFAKWRNEGKFVIFGNGAAKCAETLADATLINITPSVRGIAPLAQRAFDEGRFEDIAYFEPFYLKDFVVTTSKKKLF